MDSTLFERDKARAFSENDAHRCPDGVRSKRGTARVYPGSDNHIVSYPVRIGTWNIGSLTGKSRELVDVMQRRNLNVLCIQELRWAGQSARELGEGYKLFTVEVKINVTVLE